MCVCVCVCVYIYILVLYISNSMDDYADKLLNKNKILSIYSL